ALQRVVKGPSSMNIITASLLLSKLDNQLGYSIGCRIRLTASE
ncbi:hypothetical protein GGP94_000455, partial [Salinibacter ruber]|nr:hypothetical protein [Salinibacter ruber]